jgi:hypothetical protein
LCQDYPDFFSHEWVLKPSPTAPNFLYEVHLSRYHIFVHNHYLREIRIVLPLPTTHALYILS